MHHDLKRRAEHTGKSTFGEGWNVDGWAVAPGRVELIGNHIDYSGGPVLAAAIDRVVVMASGAIENSGQIVLIAPDGFGGVASFRPHAHPEWRATKDDYGPIVYVKGVVAALIGRGIPFRTGVGLSVAGDIPPGFGMSSSAAFCLATILSLTIDQIEPREMVAIAREAEHRAGSPVGAMDQSASVAGNVIVFDGRDTSFEQISPDLGDLVFAVADSGVDRSLRTSSYGIRVKEAEEARTILANSYDLHLPYLAALEPYWDEIQPTIGEQLSPTLLKRARHVVTETRRVRDAERMVREGNWVAFGELMNASGDSSASDYEISHPVVEELVAELRAMDGVLGARMMGGGEGGPALVLVRKDAVESVAASLRSGFYATQRIGKNEPFQVCSFGPGAHRERA